MVGIVGEEGRRMEGLRSGSAMVAGGSSMVVVAVVLVRYREARGLWRGDNRLRRRAETGCGMMMGLPRWCGEVEY